MFRQIQTTMTRSSTYVTHHAWHSPGPDARTCSDHLNVKHGFFLNFEFYSPCLKHTTFLFECTPLFSIRHALLYSQMILSSGFRRDSCQSGQGEESCEGGGASRRTRKRGLPCSHMRERVAVSVAATARAAAAATAVRPTGTESKLRPRQTDAMGN